jgi:hypothetical protein
MHPFIGKRQFTELIHEIPKGLFWGICCLIQLHRGTLWSRNPPLSFQPPSYYAFEYRFPPTNHALFFDWGFKQFNKKINF